MCSQPPQAAQRFAARPLEGGVPRHARPEAVCVHLMAKQYQNDGRQLPTLSLSLSLSRSLFFEGEKCESEF